MNTDAKIYVAGHQGLVGGAIVRALRNQAFNNLIFRTSSELDLRNQAAVNHFFSEEKPDFVFMAAARVGGILANSTYPANFIYDNLAIQNNLIDASYKNGTKKFLFLGSSCIYPKFSEQPIREDALLTGALEPTNEWYAIAKIAGIKTCQAYRKQYGFNAISVMPTNLYGPGDNFDLESSHVIPALIRKFHEAKNADAPYVTIWGTGSPKREFLYVDDLAEACILLMQHYEEAEHINVGTGKDIPIADLANLISEVVKYEGDIRFDTSKPDGTPRKVLDVSKLNDLGWKERILLRDGLTKTYEWFTNHWIDS